MSPGCSVKHQVIGSRLPGKDLILGFDVYRKLDGFRILSTGLAWKIFFSPWIKVNNFFLINPTENFQQEKARLVERSCADNDEEFQQKCEHPLWKNEAFFIKLPFKLNEDINPTKASHPDMNPDEMRLAQKECQQLIEQGLIEQTTLPWACHAFYVNKRAEQVRGKQRLVINYKPFNEFLQDDKFVQASSYIHTYIYVCM